MKLIYNINDNPKFGKLLVFAIQQVLAIITATILITGIGGLLISFGKIQITSIACALILGILVNLMLNKAKTTEAEENAE